MASQGPNYGAPVNTIPTDCTRVILVNQQLQVLSDVSTITDLLPNGVTLIQINGNTLAKPDGTYVINGTRTIKTKIDQRSVTINDQLGNTISNVTVPNTQRVVCNLKYNPFYGIHENRESVEAGSIFVPTDDTNLKGFVGSNVKMYNLPYAQNTVLASPNISMNQSSSSGSGSGTKIIDLTGNAFETERIRNENNLRKEKEVHFAEPLETNVDSRKRVRVEEPGESSNKKRRRG